jgi:hypothetical protein
MRELNTVAPQGLFSPNPIFVAHRLLFSSQGSELWRRNKYALAQIYLILKPSTLKHFSWPQPVSRLLQSVATRYNASNSLLARP